ncbi:MAG: 4'-phosphopantetheinyl transferase superfamily protein [Bacteroidales bacterium]|nr:4'-phosphopantetheinyl transferase superfamily protein [Bacteroidales bacterium]
MAIILHKEVDKCCKLGVWEISEDYDDLLSRLTLNDEEMERLEGFMSCNRKLEFLCVRVLMNEMVGNPSRIVYNNERKPFLENNSYSISISHSHQMTSVLMSHEKQVGIDLEYMSHRIQKIAERFIHEDEYITQDEDQIKYHLYIHWCAKEALYKLCDKKGIHFKKDIQVAPFEPADSGSLKGIVHRDQGTENYDLHYFRNGDYIIVWASK